MTATDSLTDPDDGHQSRPEGREGSRGIPMPASADPVDSQAVAAAALDEAADAFLIHRAQFERAGRPTGAIGRARQAAVAAAVELGALSPWEAGKGFGLDLSTVKHAVRRVPERSAGDADYAAKAGAVRAGLARRLEAGL
jgi:hypothetical protein